jgi:hypothetical protein
MTDESPVSRHCTSQFSIKIMWYWNKTRLWRLRYKMSHLTFPCIFLYRPFHAIYRSYFLKATDPYVSKFIDRLSAPKCNLIANDCSIHFTCPPLSLCFFEMLTLLLSSPLQRAGHLRPSTPRRRWTIFDSRNFR